jgi:hypothetical protein
VVTRVVTRVVGVVGRGGRKMRKKRRGETKVVTLLGTAPALAPTLDLGHTV